MWNVAIPNNVRELRVNISFKKDKCEYLLSVRNKVERGKRKGN